MKVMYTIDSTTIDCEIWHCILEILWIDIISIKNNRYQNDGLRYYHLHVPTVLKSKSLNLLRPSGPVQVCNGIADPLALLYQFTIFSTGNALNRIEFSLKMALTEGAETCSWE
jgi:hypothetical protein